MPTPIRVRFAPSPTGYLHIGGARTALFNWLVAQKNGGTFILRIEDTDRSRHVDDSLDKIVADMRWLGFDWDEGPMVNGPCQPYFQSERLDIYREYADRLLKSGRAYYAWESTEELDVMRKAAQAAKKAFRYPRPNPLPSIADGVSQKQAGKPVVVRFRMPDKDVTVVDEILGDVCLKAEELEDFVIIKADGFPTYHFACVIDDHLMKIDLVIRGQEHLMNTPKHIAMQWALGVKTPRYAHLPIIFNMSGSKMSKRDKEKALAAGQVPPEIDVHDFRLAGYLPDALINFIALLGWSPGEDREFMTRREMIDLFQIDRVGKTNAKFDRDKLAAFNTHWVAQTPPDTLLAGFKDFLALTASPMAAYENAKLAYILRACEGFRTFGDVADKTRFLTASDDSIAYDPTAVKKVLAKNDNAGYAMLEVLLPRLEGLAEWTVTALEALFVSVCEERTEKLGGIAQPIRVAVTGTTVSPPIYDSLVLLGQERTIARIKKCLATRA